LGTRLIEALARSHRASVRYESIHPGGDRAGVRATVSMKIDG